MADRCADCAMFSNHDTELPVCRLHRRYMHEDWSCSEFIKSSRALVEPRQRKADS